MESGIFLGALALLFLPYILRHRLWRLDLGTETLPVPFIATLIALVLFLASQLLVPSLLLQCCTGVALSRHELLAIAQIVAVVTAALLLVLLTCLFPQQLRKTIWGTKEGWKAHFAAFRKGALVCLVTYPFAMLLVNGTHFIVHLFGTFPEAEQDAVVFLKSLTATPWLFFSYIPIVVLVVPVVEELIFRGFFQNSLTSLLGIKWGVWSAALLFALGHYSSKQGMTNIELLMGLLFLGYVMGALYIRERSLFASIGMHATFNLLNMFVLVFLAAPDL